MKPGFNPTGWIDDLRECDYCRVDAEHLHQAGKPPLKPIPKALEWPGGPDGIYCEDCIEIWRDILATEIGPGAEEQARQARQMHLGVHCAEPGCGQPCYPDSYGCAKHTD